ncbi:mucolipin-3-like isoform X2 [Scyliorhinus canicula]|nr:mucolipin-3-like isoform X2 [Scyliorhinus canicula]XP_038649556.1 mucolipin-3-like isoform X2 [Scyliorhinus canicula]XP_038649557.1 mucolipin-3-like isoform X2 [Scyliorhinus canicula]
MESPELIINGSCGAPGDVRSLMRNGGFVHDPAVADQLRRKLKFFFMNPCEKFQARGRKPWKLGVQILKIAMVTLQLVLFGLSNQMVVLFKEENTIAFKHLFIKNYVDTTDNADNDFAIYTQSEVYEYLNFMISQYVHLRKISVGNHAYERKGMDLTPLTVCQYFYKRGSVNPGNETFNIDPKIETECFDIEPILPLFSGRLMDNKLNLTLHFHRLVMVQVQFKLKAINLQTIRRHELPDCYDFCITITFDNKAHSGRIQINLDNDVSIRECKGWHVTGGIQKNTHYMMVFDALIVVICLTSLTLCTRSVVNGIKLQYEFVDFFLLHYNKAVTWSDRMEFVNGWYILIIVSDLLTIVGSVLKLEIETKSFASYDVCSILLGTATLLVWVGVIRYLGFFEKYNVRIGNWLSLCHVEGLLSCGILTSLLLLSQVLILTLRAAFPNVIRFCCCASMIYLGYCFCGWIVLGPYHQKFRSLNMVSECLFSLINGDDMFATFAAMQDKSYIVWVFSRVYLSTFITLFIYMVLSLFIALITDTYETIKLYQQVGFPQTDLRVFIAECKDLPDSGRYRVEEVSLSLSCCCNRSENGA